MRQLILVFLFAIVMMSSVQAADLPGELERAIPEGAEDILKLENFSTTTDLRDGLQVIGEGVQRSFHEVLRERTGGAVKIFLVVLLCGLLESGTVGDGGKTAVFLPMMGALAITILAAGSMDGLLGLGQQTIHEIADFSKVLLPVLAAATAAAGGITGAAMHQVTTVFFVEVLLQLIDTLLLPLLTFYIGMLTAGTCLGDSRMKGLAEGIKKVVTWVLSAAMFLFTAYITAARLLTGTADSASIKLTKTAISGVVPVVGGILADAAETVLTGAGLLKNTIGIFGMLAILAACAYPFLQLGIQYLLYKITAFLASATGDQRLSGLIDGLGGAFGLMLGMTGSCALLLLISILSSVAAVVP